jgi:hypothetical protein
MVIGWMMFGNESCLLTHECLVMGGSTLHNKLWCNPMFTIPTSFLP